MSDRRLVGLGKGGFVLSNSLVLALLSSFSYAKKDLDTSEDVLEPIYVSARQEGEQAKDLAFSVEVMDSDTIEELRYTNLEDVLLSEPSVNLNTSGGANVSSIYIRGIGSLYPMSMDDSSVAVMLDGSPISSRNISLGTLDVERVEILKGPQGTLFGGLGEAGGINIASRKPTSYQDGYFRAEYGDDNQHLLEGAFGGALTESLSGRFAVRKSGYDHWVTNDQTGAPMSSPENEAFRGSLLWEKSERTSVLVSVEQQTIENMAEMFVLRPYSSNPSVSLTPGLYDDDEKEVKRYSVKLSHNLDNSQFTASSSYTDSYNIAPVAYDRYLNKLLNDQSEEYWQTDESHEKVFTQDVRLSSLPGADVFWVTGGSVSQSDRSYDTPYNSSGTSRARQRDFETNRYGVYGEVTFPVAQRWDLTSGLRYSWEDREYDGAYYNSGNVTTEHRELDDHFFTGRLALGYELTNTTRLYASFARGYNPGGFNDYATQSVESEPYKAAKVDSFEFGVKKASADRRYTVNGAVFYNEVTDNHLLSYDSQTFISSVVNADTRSLGAELSTTLALKNNLTLKGGVSYIDATIQSELVGIGGGDVKKGNQVPDVSPWSANVSVSWKRPLQISGLSAPMLNTRLGWKYTGVRSADPQNHFDLNAYNKIDMHIGVSIENAELYFWGNNLLDEEYDLYGYYGSATAIYGAPGRGRTLGLGVRYDL
ncbi:TonB-dependent receptor [Marinomonas rhizomae]|uniref:Iron complex outermembrane receptor protein n=1 Tax=Marinomonas rhizomae TaxID=491948 RepID=A0A366IT66_9GAMM|nr:TonB-dependent receptor [Marinomonas rhizomae]RBP77976.1 iron complex outermembrane receptor protein [Marinomonas rhizomae]RNF68999.1 TonB-dependent receptor [Marinomonas rhizomae]